MEAHSPARPSRRSGVAQSLSVAVLLLILLLAGLRLRLAGIGWGSTASGEPGELWSPITYYHPDERSNFLKVGTLAFEEPPDGRKQGEGWLTWQARRLEHNARPQSRWNVGSFNYGEMPYHLIHVLSNTLNRRAERRADSEADAAGFWSVRWGYDRLGYLGRGVNAIAGALSILVLYWIGTRAYNRTTGLVAAAFLTCCALHVQLCHYYAFEPLLVLFSLLALYACIGVAQTGRLHSYLLAAVSIGLAIATKFSGVSLPIALVAAHFVFLCTREEKAFHPDSKTPIRRTWRVVSGVIHAGLGLVLLVWLARYLRWLAEPTSAPQEFVNALCDSGRLGFWLRVLIAAGVYLVAAGLTVAAWRVVSLFRHALPPSPPVSTDTVAGALWVPARRWLSPFLPWLWMLCAVYVGLATLWVFEPHAFTESRYYTPQEAAEIARQRGPELGQPGLFWRTVNEQREMVTGRGDLPYTRQYHGTLAFVYELRCLVWDSLGLPLGLVAMAGFVVALLRIPIRPHGPTIVLQSWLLPTFVIQCLFAVRFPRYHVAEIPLFLLFGAWLLDQGLRIRLARPGALLVHIPWPWLRRLQLGAALLLVVTLVYSLGYARAVAHGFVGAHPWEEASRWIVSTIADGKRIALPHWDDRLPVDPIRLASGRSYRETDLLPLYEPDTPEKVERISRILAQADYVILPTRRLPGGTMNDPARYPLTANFFRTLYAGDLGFTLVHTERKPLRVFGVEKNDDDADESFSVYERPKVQIFERTRALEPEQIAALIQSPPEFSRTIGLRQVLHARADRSIWEVPQPRFAVLRWLAVLLLVGMVAFPMLFHLTHGSRLRGVALAIPAGMVVVGFVPWWLAGVGLVPFGRASVWGSLLFLLAGSLWCAAKQWRAMRVFLRRQRVDLTICALVFLGFFGLFLFIRAYNPAIYWGEKPMEFSFLNAVERTQSFPPADPWISGRDVNYYYYGYVLIGVLGKLAALPPRLVFNLALATIPALVALVAFGLLVGMTGRYRYGLLAALLICCCGSLVAYDLFINNTHPLQANGKPAGEWSGRSLRDAPADVVLRERGPSPKDRLAAMYTQTEPAHDGTWGAVWNTVGTFAVYATSLPRALRLYAGLLFSEDEESRNLLLDAVGFDYFYWKCGHDIIPGTAANEFPAWTFLFADLHPHMLVMPFSLLFIALCLHLLPREGVPARRPVAMGLLLGLVLGAITCINTWDMPTCTLLIVFVLVLRVWRRGSVPPSVVLWPLRALRSRRIPDSSIADGQAAPVARGPSRGERAWITLYIFVREVAFPLVLVAAVAIILYQPFHAHFAPRDRMGLGVVTRDWINPAVFTRVFGVLLFPVVCGVLFLFLRCRKTVGTLCAVLFLAFLLGYAPHFPGNLQHIAGVVASSPLLLPDARRDAQMAGLGSVSPLQDLRRALQTGRIPQDLVPAAGEALRQGHIPDELADALARSPSGPRLSRPITWARLFPPAWLAITVLLLFLLGGVWLAPRALRTQSADTRFVVLLGLWLLWSLLALICGLAWLFAIGLPALRDAGTLSPMLQEQGSQPYALPSLLLVPIVLCALALLRRRLPAAALGPLLLALVGLSVAAGIEVFLVREGTWGNTRWNTIFKFHLQVWNYLALAGSALAAVVLHSPARRPLWFWPWRFTRAVFGFLFTLLVLMGLAFAVAGPFSVTVAPGARCSRGERPTLDGLAYLRTTAPLDYDLITCFNACVPGSPVVVEAPVDSYYHDTALLSWNTGLPTIITWEHHVKERNHKPEETQRRLRDIRTLYTGDPASVRAVADAYQVDFIALGPHEMGQMGSKARERLEQASAYLGLLRRTKTSRGEKDLFVVHRDQNHVLLPLLAPNGATARTYIRYEQGQSMFVGGRGMENGQFNQPRGITVGPQGDVYVADMQNHRVQVFSATGAFRYAVGEQGSGPRQYKEPNDLAVGPDGSLYIVDTWNGRIQVLSATGEVMTDLVPPNDSFFGPRGIALLRSGWLAVSDGGHQRVVLLDRQGRTRAVVGRRDRQKGTGAGEFNEPRGVAPLADGGFVVVDSENARLQVFDGQGRWQRTIPVEYKNYTGGANDSYVATGPDGKFYVTDRGGRRVLIYSNEGRLLRSIERGSRGQFQSPIGIAIDPTGTMLYVTEQDANVVQLVRLDQPEQADP